MVPDTTGPVPTITTPDPADSTNDSPIPFRITFNEDVRRPFTRADITVTNGSHTGFTRLNATTFTFNVTPTAQGDVIVSVAAGAAEDNKGNDSFGATKTVTFDTSPPDRDHRLRRSPIPTDADLDPHHRDFGEPVTDFTLADIIVTNGTPSNFQGSGASYTFSD